MKNKILIVIPVLLIISLLALVDPFMYWMPSMPTNILLLFITVLLCVWSGFIIYEKTEDEREMQHRMYAGRVAYFSGILILTIALLVQGLTESVDPWIAFALLGMVISKVLARLYIEHHN